MRKANVDMCEGPIFSKMLIYVIPVLFTGLLQQFFSAIDVVLAGRLSAGGSDAVAAVGSTTVLTSLLINFFIGCSTGSSVAVAHALGVGRGEVVKKTVHTAMLLSVVLGLILTVFGVVFSNALLLLMSTPSDIIGLSTQYLQTYFLGMIPYMVYNFGAAVLRAVGETQKPLLFLLISGPLKIILTILFVSGMKMDVAGLAMATTCSQTVAAILIVVELIKRTDSCKLILKEIRFHIQPLKKILRLGIPSGIQSTTFSLSSVLVQSSVNSLSHLTGFIAGNAAAMSIEAFANIITSAFYQASLNFTGQNFGAGKHGRVKKVYFCACTLSSAVIATTSLLVCVFSRQLLGIYIDDSEEAIRWGTVRLLFIFAPLIFQGLMDVTSGALRGMGISFSTMLISLVGVCGLRILWIFTIFQNPLYNTPQILFLSYPITWAVTFIIQLVLCIFIFNKQKKNVTQPYLKRYIAT